MSSREMTDVLDRRFVARVHETLREALNPTPAEILERAEIRSGRIVLRSTLAAMAVVAIAGVATMLSGCTPPMTQEYFRLDDVKPGAGKLVAVRTAPDWMFWDKAEKGWVINIDGKPQFIPVDATPTDLLQELAGPLGGVASHMTIPITPGL